VSPASVEEAFSDMLYAIAVVVAIYRLRLQNVLYKSSSFVSKSSEVLGNGKKQFRQEGRGAKHIVWRN